MVKITKIKFETAVLDSGGVKTTIAKKLGVTRKAVYDYMERNPYAKELVFQEEEKILDLAEESLFTHIKKHDFSATKYILGTRGKNRGYVEKSEIAHSMDTPLIIEEHVYEGKK